MSSMMSQDQFTANVCEYMDPMLPNVSASNLVSYIGKPRMNIDMAEKEDHYCCCADLPGFKKEDINLNIDNNVLTIHANKAKLHEMGEHVIFLRRERAFGKVMRSLRLPSNINPDAAECDFVNGVLVVKIPKVAHELHKHLQIK